MKGSQVEEVHGQLTHGSGGTLEHDELGVNVSIFAVTWVVY